MMVLALLVALGAAGDPDPRFCDPQAPKRCAAPIQRGQPAPFDGQVMTTELAIDLGLKADGCDARIAQAVDYAKKLAEIDLGLERQLRKSDQQAAREAITLLRYNLNAALAPLPIYERPWFVATIAAALSVGAMSLAVWGAGQLR